MQKLQTKVANAVYDYKVYSQLVRGSRMVEQVIFAVHHTIKIMLRSVLETVDQPGPITIHLLSKNFTCGKKLQRYHISNSIRILSNHSPFNHLFDNLILGDTEK